MRLTILILFACFCFCFCPGLGIPLRESLSWVKNGQVGWNQVDKEGEELHGEDSEKRH